MHILFNVYRKTQDSILKIANKFNFDLNNLGNKKNNYILEGNDIEDSDNSKLKKQTNWQSVTADNIMKKRSDLKYVNKRFIINQQHNKIKNNHIKKLETELSNNTEKDINVNF